MAKMDLFRGKKRKNEVATFVAVSVLVSEDRLVSPARWAFKRFSVLDPM
jgi:hypothetical protein